MHLAAERVRRLHDLGVLDDREGPVGMAVHRAPAQRPDRARAQRAIRPAIDRHLDEARHVVEIDPGLATRGDGRRRGRPVERDGR